MCDGVPWGEERGRKVASYLRDRNNREGLINDSIGIKGTKAHPLSSRIRDHPSSWSYHLYLTVVIDYPYHSRIYYLRSKL